MCRLIEKKIYIVSLILSLLVLSCSCSPKTNSSKNTSQVPSGEAAVISAEKNSEPTELESSQASPQQNEQSKLHIDLKSDALTYPEDFGTLNGVMNSVCTGENGLYACWRGKVFYFDFTTEKTVQIANTDFIDGKPDYESMQMIQDQDYQKLLVNPGIRFYNHRLYYCQFSRTVEGGQQYQLMSLAPDGTDLRTVCSLERAPSEFFIWKDHLFYYFQVDEHLDYYVQSLKENSAVRVLSDYICRRLVPLGDRYYFTAFPLGDTFEDFYAPLVICDQNFNVLKQTDEEYFDRIGVQKGDLILTKKVSDGDEWHYEVVKTDGNLESKETVSTQGLAQTNEEYTLIYKYGNEISTFQVLNAQGQEVRNFSFPVGESPYLCLGISSHYLVFRDSFADSISKGIYVYDVLDNEQTEPRYIVSEKDLIS